MARGTLIVFEGLDKAGKSTQCTNLVSRLQERGRKVKHIRFPDRTTPIGKMIDAYLKGDAEQEDHVIHLLFSANRWELAKSIEESIQEGTIVVVDRYYYSGCVYSAAKQNPSLSLSWCRQPEVGLPRPDICVFLDIAAAEAAKRGGYGGERYESSQMQSRVRDLFQTMREGPEKDDFVVVDGGRELHVVEQDVQEVVEAATKRVEADGLPLRKVQPW